MIKSNFDDIIENEHEALSVEIRYITPPTEEQLEKL